MTDRDRLVGRWLELTRSVLPAMAADQGWPIRADHCFMRVCLDAMAKAPWPQVIARPAIRHMSDAQFAAAIAVAESIVLHPETLRPLNAASLRHRRQATPQPAP